MGTGIVTNGGEKRATRGADAELRRNFIFTAQAAEMEATRCAVAVDDAVDVSDVVALPQLLGPIVLKTGAVAVGAEAGETAACDTAVCARSCVSSLEQKGKYKIRRLGDQVSSNRSKQ